MKMKNFKPDFKKASGRASFALFELRAGLAMSAILAALRLSALASLRGGGTSRVLVIVQISNGCILTLFPELIICKNQT
jgi:hypothetical protein